MIKHLYVLAPIVLLGASLVVPQAQADRRTSGDLLLIEKVRERMSRELPVNGLSMAEVEQLFGAPLQRRDAIGDPPITRWVYQDYSVFFEYQRVIESVLHPEAVIREAQIER